MRPLVIAAISVFLVICCTARPEARGSRSDIVITFDDLPVATALRDPLSRQQQISRDLIAALRQRRVPVIGFVNGNKFYVDGRIDPSRVALLDAWADAGFEIGNHTFSHSDLHSVGAAKFGVDIERGDAAIRTVAERHHQTIRYFRHPYLHTGTSAEARDEVERVLAAHDYRVAPVTIDNSDWIFARAFDEAELRKDPALRERITAEYVRYMLAKVDYYDQQSAKLFGRRVPQVLLVHANALNAYAFGGILDILRIVGHRFIALDEALSDAAYQSPDRYFGPSGISWMDRWALTRGVPGGFFREEPRTPQWILDVAGVNSE
ncbi:MAG: polysaccharide deacetylase family protein [Acidobacteriota bacterium]